MLLEYRKAQFRATPFRGAAVGASCRLCDERAYQHSDRGTAMPARASMKHAISPSSDVHDSGQPQ